MNVEFVPTRNPIEEKLAQIWAEVLNIERVGVNNNFSNLGGDSLLATVLFSKVIETFKIETSLEEFYKRATIAEQALFISSLIDI
ncbi:phosphopantetheine-binding protein [Chloroflexota bacterium]